MENVLMIAGGLGGLALGALGGYRLGRVLSQRHAWGFWTANVVFVALGIGIALVGLTRDARWLSVAALGLEAGGLTALKYGYRGAVAA